MLEDCIRTATELRDLFGPVSGLAEKKVLARIDRHAAHFISLSPLLVLATSDGAGHADASPRGDAPGFVQVLDEATLLIPDRRGNNRVDSYGNILASPGVGLIFFVPGIDETLRVNGAARLATDADLLAPSTVEGKAPKAGLVVAVQEVFFHCGKALKRARLWDASRHVPRQDFPTLGRIIIEQTGGGMAEAKEADAQIEDAYRTRLY
jgi:uncharacterized protein